MRRRGRRDDDLRGRRVADVPHHRRMVLDNATEAGRMVRGIVTESELFSQFRAHYRCKSRYCNPYSGNEKGCVENAVGFLRRNLLVPEPVVSSVAELNRMLDAATLSIAVIVLSTNPRTWQSQILGDDRPFYRCLSGRSTFGLTPTFAT